MAQPAPKASGATTPPSRATGNEAGTPPTPTVTHRTGQLVSGGRAAEWREAQQKRVAVIALEGVRDTHFRAKRRAAIEAANRAALEASFGADEEARMQAMMETGSVEAVLASLEELMVMSEEDDASPEEADDDQATIDDAAEEPAGTKTAPDCAAGRPRRAAAMRAVAVIADHSAEDRRKIREMRKRPVEALYGAKNSDEQQEEDDLVDEVCKVKCVTERENQEGTRWYRVRGEEVAEGEREYSWVPEAGRKGARAWKDVVDRYYDEALPKNPELLFRHFLDQDMAIITMSAMRVYTAIAKIMELQQATMRLTAELVAGFEAREKLDRVAQKGLTADQIKRLLDFLVKRGWKNKLHRSQYRGGVAGPVGLALAAKDPGLFFVGTIEPPRTGNCFVLEFKEDRSCFVHEGGITIRLGQYQYAQQIRWVRRCSITEGRGTLDEAESEGGENVTEPLEVASAPMAIRRKKKSRRKRTKKEATADLTAIKTE